MPAPSSGSRLSSRQYRGQTRVDVTGALKKLEALSVHFEKFEFADAMEELKQIGIDSMHESILKNESAPFSSIARQLGVNKGPGRYRTGRMYNSVAGRLQNGPKTYKVIVGYLKNIQNYFKYQDRGFWNIWKLAAVGEGYNGRISTGPNAPAGLHFIERKQKKWTEGTYALRDARQNMIDAIPRIVKKFETKIKKRANRIK